MPTKGNAEATATRSGLASDGAVALPRVRQLVVVGAAHAGERCALALRRGAITIGRAPEGDRTLAIDDDEASRAHAAVEHDPRADAWSIVDAGSRNGTFVDGARIASRTPLRHGSVIRIGRALLVFVDVELPAGLPLVDETPELLGRGLAMSSVRGQIARVAPEAIAVLVLGETGVGKERVAHAVHAASGRKGPFVPVNCAAIPSGLAESELFGHAQGAFTGATQRSEGLFAAADGGTLFLDEVGELPEAVQAKLLRALATGEARALGRAEARKYDVRIVAATHRDVEREVAAGTFRGDLFARLAGWTIRVPPLRERRDDVLRLAEAFLARGGAPSLSTSAGEALLLHDWPYNVRELEQVLAAAALRAKEEGIVRAVHLPPAIAGKIGGRQPQGARAAEAPLEALVDRDRVPDAEDLRLAFERFGGNVKQIAAFFGRDRRQVYRWLDRSGIDVASLRGDDD